MNISTILTKMTDISSFRNSLNQPFSSTGFYVNSFMTEADII